MGLIGRDQAEFLHAPQDELPADAGLSGVSIRTKTIRRLRQSGQQGSFTQGQVSGTLAIEPLCGGLGTENVAAVRCQIEIGFEDLIFRPQLFELPGPEDLPQFGRQRSRLTVQLPADLHGEGAGTGDDFQMCRVLADRPDQRRIIDPVMLVKSGVFCGESGLHKPGRDVLERHRLTPVVIFADEIEQGLSRTIGDYRADRLILKLCDREGAGIPNIAEPGRREQQQPAGSKRQAFQPEDPQATRHTGFPRKVRLWDGSTRESVSVTPVADVFRIQRRSDVMHTDRPGELSRVRNSLADVDFSPAMDRRVVRAVHARGLNGR